MNYKYLIKPVAVLALFCGAPVLQAQILGGGAGGGLGGSLGGTLGGGMGSIGGMGQGNANGTLGGSLERTGELRRHATGAVDSTRDITRHVRDRVGSTRDTVQNTASSASNGIAGGVGNAAGNASGSLSGATAAAKGAARTEMQRAISPARAIPRKRQPAPPPSAAEPCRWWQRRGQSGRHSGCGPPMSRRKPLPCPAASRNPSRALRPTPTDRAR